MPTSNAEYSKNERNESSAYASSSSPPSNSAEKVVSDQNDDTDREQTSLPEVGSVWINELANEPWPVITCEPAAAPDPSIWAILLGKHEYILVRPSKLAKYDPRHDYLQDRTCVPSNDQSDKEAAKESLRRAAFKQDLAGSRDLHFWMDHIEHKTGLKAPLEQRPVQKTFPDQRATLKRRRSPTPSYDSGYDYIHDTPAQTAPRKSSKPRADAGIPVRSIATRQGCISPSAYSARSENTGAARKKYDHRSSGQSVLVAPAKKL